MGNHERRWRGSARRFTKPATRNIIMGTRGLTAVVENGDYRIAQYGQWDHYPSGQGVTALEFLRTMDEPRLRKNLARCAWITEEQQKAVWTRIGIDIDKTGGWVDVQDSKRFYAQPETRFLSRDHGAKILGMVQDDTSDDSILLVDSSTFAADSLFCEYAYVIDLDQRTFEVYEGFNKGPVSAGERFANLPTEEGSKYSPVRLLASFSLDDLPTKEAFLAACNEPVEDDV